MTADPRDEEFQIGDVIAERYVLEEALAKGGFSQVYRARQIATDKLVAIKLLHPKRLEGEDAPIQIARFEREMRLISGLKHPNIVPLIDSGRLEDGQLFIVLEFITGSDLNTLLEAEGALSLAETRRLMLQVLEALSAAHEAGIVHRDLKPHNIMVSSAGLHRNALVLDFGMGAMIKDAQDQDYKHLTSDDKIYGTPSYMPPEQLLHEALTPQSDIYAWGLVLLECLTGRQAVRGESMMHVVKQQLSAKPVRIPPVIAAHPIGKIIAHAIAKDREKRAEATAALYVELEACPVDIDTFEIDEDEADDEGDTSDDAPQDDPDRVTQSWPNTRDEDSGAELVAARREGAQHTRANGASKNSPLLLGLLGALLLVIAIVIASGGDNDTKDEGNTTHAGTNIPDPPTDPSPPDTPGDDVQDDDAAPTDARAEDVEAAEDMAPVNDDPEAQCNAGDHAVCVELGAAQFIDGERTFAAAKGALPYFKKACEGGSQAGCVELGRLYDEGLGVIEDTTLAYSLFEAACQQDNAEGCYHQADMIREGRGVKRDSEASALLFGRACDLGSLDACERYGVSLFLGKGVDVDIPGALNVFVNACEAGHGDSCKRLGGIYDDGELVTRDLTATLYYYDRACENGSASSCIRAGKLKHYEDSLGIDHELATAYYDRACDLDDPEGCLLACYMYMQGEGIPQSNAEAIPRCQIACDGYEAKGCYRLYRLLKDEAQTDEDRVRAEEALDLACRYGEEKACK